jgi:hypothetical protein
MITLQLLVIIQAYVVQWGYPVEGQEFLVQFIVANLYGVYFKPTIALDSGISKEWYRTLLNLLHDLVIFDL